MSAYIRPIIRPLAISRMVNWRSNSGMRRRQSRNDGALDVFHHTWRRAGRGVFVRYFGAAGRITEQGVDQLGVTLGRLAPEAFAVQPGLDVLRLKRVIEQKKAAHMEWRRQAGIA